MLFFELHDAQSELIRGGVDGYVAINTKSGKILGNSEIIASRIDGVLYPLSQAGKGQYNTPGFPLRGLLEVPC